MRFSELIPGEPGEGRMEGRVLGQALPDDRRQFEEKDAGSEPTATFCIAADPDHEAQGENQGAHHPEDEAGKATDSRPRRSKNAFLRSLAPKIGPKIGQKTGGDEFFEGEGGVHNLPAPKNEESPSHLQTSRPEKRRTPFFVFFFKPSPDQYTSVESITRKYHRRIASEPPAERLEGVGQG